MSERTFEAGPARVKQNLTISGEDEQPGSPVLARLMRGFTEFHAENYECSSCHRDINRCYQKAVDHGQKPNVMVVSCADSRVHNLFNAHAGEVFSHKNLGNIISPRASGMFTRLLQGGDYPRTAMGTIGALQYGLSLGVSAFVVVGHTKCGAMKGLTEDNTTGPVRAWLKQARTIVQDAQQRYTPQGHEELLRAVEKENVRRSVAAVEEYLDRHHTPASGTNRPEVHGLLFDLDAGNLSRLADVGSGHFEPLTNNPRRIDRGRTPGACPESSHHLFERPIIPIMAAK